jgi:Ring finger domain
MNTCTICESSLCNGAMFITGCGHKFHFSCIKNNTTCPICKKILDEFIHPVPEGHCRYQFQRGTDQYCRRPVENNNIYCNHCLARNMEDYLDVKVCNMR